jgi:hypothetical protein
MHRRNILGQCPKTIPSSALEDIRMEKFYAQRKAENFVKVGQSILDLLNEPISRPEFNPKFALHPTHPGQPYDKPLPTTQDYEMQPFLHELLPIMRALDTFNIQAASQLRSMEEEKERMERDGQSKTPLVMRRKRSASVAKLDKLDERPPMKPPISNAKPEERPHLKRVVSFAKAEEDMLPKRRESGMMSGHSSPRARVSSINESSSHSPISGDPISRRVIFALPTSAETMPSPNRDPRPSSGDPRLINRSPRAKD